MDSTKPARRSHDRGPALPLNISRKDLKIYDTWDEDKFEQCDFMYKAPTGEIFIGHSHRQSNALRVSTMKAALKRAPDDEVYPRLPERNNNTTTTTTTCTTGTPLQPLTLAPADILADPSQIFEKQPDIGWCCVSAEEFAARMFHEARIMQMTAEKSHPYIIKYYGLRVERELVKSLVFERLDKALVKYAATREFARLDKGSFFRRLESAVRHLHSLGLAHNDIHPNNVMIRERENGEVEPVLIDFGSCAPVGEKLQFTLGTPGWYEEEFDTSEKEHDLYALGKMKKWLHAADSQCVCS
ncbi:hypothetical protein ASPCAL08077 [Aspergillus calidoustus]|uniref:Protein kinase domain-containing protein n=1 Tax=Aspergillus calidoustus TaxID=454130 RepID=A0A0U5GQL5_ASPCI|nr:hypothetical protein ASPCAL08077 [Aspergillus calidoustus]